jgi:hypothetical protein
VIVDELEEQWQEHCPTKEVEAEIYKIGAELLIFWKSEKDNAGDPLKWSKHKCRPNKSALMFEMRVEDQAKVRKRDKLG